MPRSIVIVIDYSQLPYVMTSVEAAKSSSTTETGDRMALVTDDVQLLAELTSVRRR